jgi:prolyl-tRNA synthetase
MGKWIQSYRDLPLLLNCWNNVVRWEMRPRLFLRTTEFLWQEGHTAHATAEDSNAYAEQILRDVYVDFMVNVLAIPVLPGRKTAAERFPGAINTLTVEAMMGDGKALQMGTSHDLGQNFAKVFDITYLDANGDTQLCWTTSWGTSTRMVGGLIMAHGDDQGLVVPPVLASIQAVVLLVRDEHGAGNAAELLRSDLAEEGVRVRLDAQVATSFGRRATDWEIKGVPIRIEVGPRDLAEGLVTVVRRDTGDKQQVALSEVTTLVPVLLAEIQTDMLTAATRRRDDRTVDVGSIEEAVEAAKVGFARIPWDLVKEGGEARLAQDAITVRCLQTQDGGLPTSEDAPDLIAYVARSY